MTGAGERVAPAAAMTEQVSVQTDGPEGARAALEQCVGSGGVAVFPADGLYGLACDPTNAGAVDRIQEIKGREDRKPSAVMYFSPLAMRELLADLGPRTSEAAGKLLPGPLTLVIANPGHRYPLACREDPERLGVRLIEGPLAGAMTPVFQTSANRSGEAGRRRLTADVGAGLEDRAHRPSERALDQADAEPLRVLATGERVAALGVGDDERHRPRQQRADGVAGGGPERADQIAHREG